jgi:oligosaccharyl transferase complex subunit OST4
MITDGELYRLAIFLGSAAAVLIILHTFFEVNAKTEDGEDDKEKAPLKTGSQSATANTKTR